MNRIRWKLIDALEWCLSKVDENYEVDQWRREREIECLRGIATGKIKPEDARAEAYAAMY